MARPRSKDKEMALLRSAVKIIATRLRASTMMIARLAGVAEGTLFLYFPTKDVLLSAVFEHLLQDLEAGLGAPAAGVVAADRAILWNRYIDGGAANPDAYSTMNQLLASDRLSAGQLRRVETLYAFPDLQACRRRFAGLTDREALALSDATEKAIADTTVRLAMTRPQHAEAYKMAGFDMLGRGDAGAEPLNPRAQRPDHIGRLPDGHDDADSLRARHAPETRYRMGRRDEASGFITRTGPPANISRGRRLSST